MNKIVISNREPQQITIGGGGQVIGITEVLVNGVDVTVGSVAYVVVPTKTSQLQNDSGFLTHETDPTIPYYIKQITQADINSWNNKQNQLVSGVNIKTINENSLLGSGNIDISTSYTAGTGIEITEENVINNTITSYNDLTDLPTIPTKTSDLLNDSDFVTSTELSSVAFSGDYDDLDNKPTIPTQTSQLENNSGFITNNTDELTYYYTKDYLYNLLPKVSDSGTKINLDDTYTSDLKMILSPSELSQDGTPTPSSPQDIHLISGDNTISVCGKNLFSSQMEIGGINNTTGATESNNSCIRTIDYIKVEPSTTYSLSNDKNYQLLIYEYDTNKTFIQYTGNFSNPKYWTTQATTQYIKVRSAADQVQTDLTTKYMLNLGGTALSYEAYNGDSYSVNLGNIEYSKISTYEDKFIRNSGKQVFDYDKFKNDYSTQTSGTPENFYFASNGSECKYSNFNETTTYHFSGSWSSTKSNGQLKVVYTDGTELIIFADYSSSTSASGTFDISTDGTKTISYLRFITWSGANYTLKDFMLNLGETALDYEPYGNGTWYLKQEIEKYTFVDTDNWVETDNHLQGCYTVYKKTPAKLLSNTYIPFCSNLKGVNNPNYGTQATPNSIGISADRYNVYIPSVTTVADCKTTMANQTVYFVLDTPTYTQITGTLEDELEEISKAQSKSGQTNISQINYDLPFVISATTLKDISNL